ncbi:CHAT domain-containing protein [Aquimarina algiphila]|uniref:CHAT domain-containing protein n=1 Tax=Aquimarina algiphila TaxID=2047982 RepID=A0A554VDP5_9FLAO|nr:CHAT domain-containing tetratricopeptide repeat protein [Aquimarina algiphila]TSE05010.1 CHAT domain-containing protein [Aquimarina algiphila]
MHNGLLYYKKALSVQQNVDPKNYNEIFTSYSCIGTAYTKLSNYKMALVYHEKALIVGRKAFAADHISIGLIHNKIGNVYQYLRQYDKALFNYRKDLEIIIKNFGNKHYYVGLSYMNIGIVYVDLMQYDTAFDYYKKALLIFDKEERLDGLLYLYNNIGNLLIQKGEYDKALLYNNKSLDIGLKIYDRYHEDMAVLYMNSGDIFHSKSNYKRALYYYDKALLIFKEIFGENHFRLKEIFNRIGNAYSKKKEYNTALKYYKKALKINKYLFENNGPEITNSYIQIGRLYFKQDMYEKALLFFEKGLDILQNINSDEYLLTSESYFNIAKIFHKQEQYEKAITYYDRALLTHVKNKGVSDFRNAFDPNQYYNLQSILKILKGKAQTLQSQFLKNNDFKYLDQGIAIYKNADKVVNEIRQSYQNYEDKVSFAKQAKELYKDAINAHLLSYKKTHNQQDLEEAFYYAEKSKANILKELLNDTYAKGFAGLPEEIIEVGKILKTNRAFYQGQIIEQLSSESIDTIKINDYENKLFDLNRKEDSLTHILETKYPKYYQLKYQNEVIHVDDIQQKLDVKTTLLEFFTSDSTSYVFIVSKNNIYVQELQTPGLEKRIKEFHESITSIDLQNYKKQSQHLYNELIKPVEDKFLGDQLIIIPDGSLWHLNFELLLTQKDDTNNPALLSYLLNKYAITYANSSNLLFNSFKNEDASNLEIRRECLAFSFSDSTQITETNTIRLLTLRDAGGDLPGTRREIKAISDIVDGQYYYGSQAIEANFKENASRYNILHLALHGEVDNDRPENSKLYFTKSKDTIEDNLLYSHEIFALNIPAELTVLSACKTGTGKIARGEGIMSLGNAFQYAGTKSLLLTSWDVSDQTTPELMKFFYANLKEGMNKAKALQQAKLQYLASANINRLDPFYWGGFYLVGDSSPIPFKNNTTLYWVLGVIMFVILLFLFFWYRRKIKN